MLLRFNAGFCVLLNDVVETLIPCCCLYVVRTSSLPCWLLVCSNFTWSWACYWCLNAMLLNLSPSIAWNSQDQWSSIGCWLFAWALFHWFHPMRTFHFVCQCCVVSISEEDITLLPLVDFALTTLPCHLFILHPTISSISTIYFSFNFHSKIMKFFAWWSQRCLLFYGEF